MTKYILVDWPEIQDYMEHPRYRECYSANSIDENEATGVWFVPEDLYEEVTYKLQFPKVYDNTNLGTIVCYETRAVVNGEDTYWYDEDLIKRGSEILVYNHDIEDLPKWIITKCAACSAGFPILLENDHLCPGINCEIIGVKV